MDVGIIVILPFPWIELGRFDNLSNIPIDNIDESRIPVELDSPADDDFTEPSLSELPQTVSVPQTSL